MAANKPLVYLGLGLLVVFGITFAMQFLQAPTKRVNFFGQFENIDLNQLRQLSDSWGSQLFYTLDEDELQQQLKQLSWLEKAEVSLQYLGEIRVVNLKERKPFFRWQEDNIVDSYGRAFEVGPRTYRKYRKLPILVVEKVEVDSLRLVITSLEKLPLIWREELQQVVIHPWRVIEFKFSGFKVVVDSESVVQKLALLPGYLISLQRYYEDQFTKVDLRYNNGMSFE